MKACASALLVFATGVCAQTGGTIEGTVTSSATHAGVPGVSVSFSNGDDASYYATTGVDGIFRITGVEPGNYHARYDKSGFVQLELPLFGQPPLRVGTTGTVRADAELSPRATVRGRVLDPEGKPAANVTVEMGIASVETDDEGRFELKGVRPGTWDVSAESGPKQDNGVSYFLATGMVPAPVSDHDLESVQLRFGPNFSVSVAADWGDQKPPANYLDRLPSVMLVPPPGMRQALQMAMPAQRAPAERVAFQHMVPGRYRIIPRPGVPAGFYVAAIMLGGQNILEEEVELTSATPEIHVVYKPNPCRIAGTVDHGGGATVLLWPNSGGIPPAVRFARVDDHWSFAFSNVAPGDYSLVAFDRVDDSGGSDSFVLGAVAAGKRVTIQEGDAESVQLTVTHWPE